MRSRGGPFPNVGRRRRRTAEKKLGELFFPVTSRPSRSAFSLLLSRPAAAAKEAKGNNSHSRRLLSLKELQAIMANFARPVASSIAGVDFGVYTDEDVKAISVKRIHNTPTLDSFNNPVPGGLYDPALGAWGDHV